MNISSKKGVIRKDMLFGIWKSPNTDNVVKDNDYDNGNYADYISQSIIANSFYEHITSLPSSIEIPESNLTINAPKDDEIGRGITIVKLDKSNKVDIQLSHTFCSDKLSAVNIDYMIPSDPGYLVMVLFGKDSRGKHDIICALRFHFEPLLSNVNSEYPIEAHLDGFCKNCDNINISGAGIGINIFFEICKQWNVEYENQIVQYRLEALPGAFLYWRQKFGFMPEYSESNENELVPMTKSGPEIMEEDVGLEHPLVRPILTNDQMEVIDWAVTWDELTEGLEQEMRHQQDELRRGMSKRHRKAWGDERGGSNKKTNNKKKTNKKKKTARQRRR
jgi:hypothetical protein